MNKILFVDDKELRQIYLTNFNDYNFLTFYLKSGGGRGRGIL